MIFIYCIQAQALASASVFLDNLPKSLSKLASVLLAISVSSLKTPSTEKSSTFLLIPASKTPTLSMKILMTSSNKAFSSFLLASSYIYHYLLASLSAMASFKVAADSKQISQTSSSLALAPTTAINKLSILDSLTSQSLFNNLVSSSVPKQIKQFFYLITI